MKNAEKNIISVVKNKQILFLENDNSLHDSVDVFHWKLKKNGFKPTVFFEVGDAHWEDITNTIDAHDVIIFQTTWTYEISLKIKKHIESLTTPKIIIEVYINKPTWFKKPDTIHDVYIYKADHKGTWFDPKKGIYSEYFHKLDTNIAYWDFKNNFDK